MTARITVAALRYVASLLIFGAMLGTACAQPSAPTITVLDFQRIGTNQDQEWLGRGLADLTITAYSLISPYQVVDRERLQTLLKEQGFQSSGIVDSASAVEQGRIVKADRVVLGNFALDGATLHIEARVLNVSSQQIVATGSWKGNRAQVLDAPLMLTRQLLASEGQSATESGLTALSDFYPPSVEVAEAFYSGMGTFDEGLYGIALGFYLEGSTAAGSFHRIYKKALEMYYLLDLSGQGFLFANRIASGFEQTHLSLALELHYLAAQTAFRELKDHETGYRTLNKIISLADTHEAQTDEARRIKLEVGKSLTRGWSPFLIDANNRYLIWYQPVSKQLGDIEKDRRRGQIDRYIDQRWVREPPPRMSVFMWRLAALLSLVEHLQESQQYGQALLSYTLIHAEYEPLCAVWPEKQRSSWCSNIFEQARKAQLSDYEKSGELVRVKFLMERSVEATDETEFRRVFEIQYQPDSRAWRHWQTVDKSTGNESYDFVAPPGHQIRSVTVNADVNGMSSISLRVPGSKGNHEQFYGGKKTSVFILPQSSDIVTATLAWGCEISSSRLACLRGWLDRDKDEPELREIVLRFETTPKNQRVVVAAPAEKLNERDQYLMQKHARKYGWSDVGLYRDADTRGINQLPHPTRGDWLVFSQEGDLRLWNRRDPAISSLLPLPINTSSAERQPSLIKTFDQNLALFWTREREGQPALFVAQSADMKGWSTPRVVQFNRQGEDTKELQGVSVKFQDTPSIIQGVGEYMMLLSDGRLAVSQDLHSWEVIEKIYGFEGRNGQLLTVNNTVWIVYSRFDNDAVEIVATRSDNGRNWEEFKSFALKNQPSGMWSFTIDQRQAGIAVQYNNLTLEWYVLSGNGELRKIESGPQLYLELRPLRIFLQDNKLNLARVIYDHDAKEAPLLITRSANLHNEFKSMER